MKRFAFSLAAATLLVSACSSSDGPASACDRAVRTLADCDARTGGGDSIDPPASSGSALARGTTSSPESTVDGYIQECEAASALDCYAKMVDACASCRENTGCDELDDACDAACTVEDGCGGPDACLCAPGHDCSCAGPAPY